MFIFIKSGQLKRILNNYDFYLFNVIILAILLQVGRFMFYGDRLAASFEIINIVMLSKLPEAFQGKKNKLFAQIIVVCLCLFYWWYIYGIGGVGHTYPYELMN